jgi:murein L,D-transpeptidase YafK
MHHPILRLLSLFLIASLLSAASACTEATPPPPAISQPEPAKQLIVDRVVVVKSSHTLELHHEGQVLETFPVSLGPHLHGPKREAGDGRTPEGVYRIDWRSLKTRYTRELHISYPDAKDRARAQAMHVEPGGGIFIHGVPADYGPYDPPERFHDWTDGCISVGNAAIVRIWNAVPDGTPIEILP